MLLEAIQFLSLSFLFLAMSRSSRVRFRLFAAWNVHEIAFLPFWFSTYCSVDPCVICVVSGRCNYSFSALFMQSSIRLIDESSLFSVVIFLLFLTHIFCLYKFWDLRPSFYIVISFLVSGPFVEVLLSSILWMFPSILRMDQPRCVFLWWDFCYIVWFRAVFSFSWGFLLNFFLSSPHIWCCPLPIFLSVCKFRFLREYWFF